VVGERRSTAQERRAGVAGRRGEAEGVVVVMLPLSKGAREGVRVKVR